MAITINGTVGIDFNVTESDDALATGTIVQRHITDNDISDIVLDNTDLVASLSGFIGTTNVVLDLTDLVSVSGGDFDISVVRNHDVPFKSIKSIVIHNKTLLPAANILNLEAGMLSFIEFSNANNALFINPATAISFVYPTPFEIATRVELEFMADTLNTPLEIFILGTPTP